MRLMRKSIFDKPINRLLDELATKQPGTDDFNKLLEELQQLTSLQEKERNKRVKSDTVWIVMGNLVGILVIVAYEQKHVMASRGMNFILKPKQN